MTSYRSGGAVVNDDDVTGEVMTSYRFGGAVVNERVLL